MLEKLALNHDTWVRMARDICKDNYLADDLVSEMYLKVSEYKDKSINAAYVYQTLRSIFIDMIRERNNRLEYSFTDIGDADAVYEIDEAFPEIDLSVKPVCLTWVEWQILLIRQDKSGRDIEKQYRINFQKVHRIEKIAKNKLREWVTKTLEGQAI